MSEFFKEIRQTLGGEPNLNVPGVDVLCEGYNALVRALNRDGHPFTQVPDKYTLRCVLKTAQTGTIKGLIQPTERALAIPRLAARREAHERPDLLVYPFVRKRGEGVRRLYFVIDELHECEGDNWTGRQFIVPNRGFIRTRVVGAFIPGVWTDLCAPNETDDMYVDPYFDIAYYFIPRNAPLDYPTVLR